MTTLDRLNRYYVLAAGLLLLAIIALVAFMVGVRPAMTQYEQKQSQIAQEQTVVQRRASAQRQLEEANAALENIKAEYALIKTERNPEIRMATPFDTLHNFVWPEVRDRAGPTMRGWFQAQGMPFEGIVAMPNPGTTPIAMDAQAIEIPLGKLGVTTPNFPALLDFLPNLKETPRIAVMGDELTIIGPSPQLRVEWQMRMYLLTELPPQGVQAPGAPGPAVPATPPAGQGLQQPSGPPSPSGSGGRS